MPSFLAITGAQPTTAAAATVSTGTAIKTLLHVTAGTSSELTVWKWGVSFDGTGTTPILVELIHTTTVAPTDTAGTATNFGVNATAVPAAATCGFNATVEGTVVATTRLGDLQQVLPGNFFQNEFSLGREFYVPPSGVVRVRVTAPVSVNAYAFIAWDE